MVCIAVLVCAATVARSNGMPKLQTGAKTMGKILNRVYTSPDRDFRVAVPNTDIPGASARDEGDDEVWQVIFTDDFGGFYRLLSLKNPKGELSADRVLTMKSYADAFEKEIVNTTRGREVRFVDVEKEGAEITVQTSRRLPDGSITWDKKTPDLITANAVFEANGRLYHVIAGIAKTDKMEQLTAIARAKQKLEKFLNGVELLKPQK
jgi:hypothetical protein